MKSKKHLSTAMRSNEIDIAVALFDGDDQQFLFQHWKQQLTWVGATDFEIPDGTNIPLVAHPYGCVCRDRMAAALKLAGRSWRIAFSSPGIGGIQRAVQDGLGLSCLTTPTVQSRMRKFTEKDGLPVLTPLHIGLFARQAQLGAGDTRPWMQDKEMKHSRGAPYHPQTQGKIPLVTLLRNALPGSGTMAPNPARTASCWRTTSCRVTLKLRSKHSSTITITSAITKASTTSHPPTSNSDGTRPF